MAASPFHTYITRLIIRPVASRGWALFIAWQLHASSVIALTRSAVCVDSRDRSHEVTVSDARNRASDKRTGVACSTVHRVSLGD